MEQDSERGSEIETVGPATGGGYRFVTVAIHISLGENDEQMRIRYHLHKQLARTAPHVSNE